jgi:hypothetical protein
VGRRLLPALLVAAAAIADASGAHGLARDALLGAVPLAAVEAIAACGTSLDRRTDGGARLQAILSSLVVALIVLSCAMRSGSVQGVPQLAVSAVLISLALLGLKALLALAPQLRRLADIWPAKP